MPSPSACKRLNDYLDEHGYRFVCAFVANRSEHAGRSVEKYVAPNGAPVIVEVWGNGSCFEVYGALDNTNSVADTMTALATYGDRR